MFLFLLFVFNTDGYCRFDVFAWIQSWIIQWVSIVIVGVFSFSFFFCCVPNKSLSIGVACPKESLELQLIFNCEFFSVFLNNVCAVSTERKIILLLRVNGTVRTQHKNSLTANQKLTINLLLAIRLCRSYEYRSSAIQKREFFPEWIWC